MLPNLNQGLSTEDQNGTAIDKPTTMMGFSWVVPALPSRLFGSLSMSDHQADVAKSGLYVRTGLARHVAVAKPQKHSHESIHFKYPYKVSP